MVEKEEYVEMRFSEEFQNRLKLLASVCKTLISHRAFCISPSEIKKNYGPYLILVNTMSCYPSVSVLTSR